MPFDRDGNHYDLPYTGPRDRWWLVLLVIVSGPAVALVLHLLGV